MQDIVEILVRWQAEWSTCAISRSLGVSRPPIQKNVRHPKAIGYQEVLYRLKAGGF